MAEHHPAFPYAWPESMHPYSFIFLHPPFDENGSAGVSFETPQLNSLGKFLEDLGVKLPNIAPRSITLRIRIVEQLSGAEDEYLLDQPLTIPVPDADKTAWRIVTGSRVPPGLGLDKHGGLIVGRPSQSGSWIVRIHVGPLVHYQPPLVGEIGPNNLGQWVDIDKPIERQIRTPELDDLPLEDLPEQEIEKVRTALARYDAMRAKHRPPHEEYDNGSVQS